jgi:hypothetical protein
MRLRALLLLLASFSCWTDEIVLLLVPSLSQECINSTEDDEAIVARSANQKLYQLQIISPAKTCSALRTIRKQFKSFTSPVQDECLALPSRLYELMSLQL